MTSALDQARTLLEAEGHEVVKAKGALELRSGDGEGIRIETGDDGVTVVLVAPITGPTLRLLPGAGDEERRQRLARLVDEVAMTRSGLLTATVEEDAVRIGHPVRADGLSRHALASAVGEVLKARRQLEAALVGRGDGLAVEDLFPETSSLEEPTTTFSPTHAVPTGGLLAWDQPDPEAPAAATLPPGSGMQVLNTWGDWAQVRVENGWQGWVDARMLGPR